MAGNTQGYTKPLLHAWPGRRLVAPHLPLAAASEVWGTALANWASKIVMVSRTVEECSVGTVNLSGRVSRVQATCSGHWGLLPTRTADFGPDLEFLGPGSSMRGGSDVIAAEVEEVIDLVVC